MVQPCTWDVGSGTSPMDDQIPPVSLGLWFSHLRNGDNFNKPVFLGLINFVQCLARRKCSISVVTFIVIDASCAFCLKEVSHNPSALTVTLSQTRFLTAVPRPLPGKRLPGAPAFLHTLPAGELSPAEPPQWLPCCALVATSCSAAP